MPPSGLPDAFLEDVPDALRALASGTRARTGRSRPRSCAPATASTSSSALRELEAAGTLVRGELRPTSHPLARPGEREWCDPDVLRRLRRASLAVLRREIEPAERRALAAFLPSWQGIDRHPAAGAGIERLREILVPLQGLALPAELWERAMLPRRTGAYSTTLARPALRLRRARLGRRRGRSAAAAAASRSTSATTPPRSGRRPPPPSSSARASAEHELIRERLRAAPCFFGDLRRPRSTRRPRRSRRRCGTSSGPARSPTTPGRRCARRASRWRARRAPGRAPAAASRPRCAPRAATRARPCRAAGRWRRAVRAGARPGRAAAHDRRAAARAPRHPDARAGARGGRRGRLRRALRLARRARDDRRLPPRLLHRGPRRRPVRAARERSSGCARTARSRRRRRSCSPPPIRRSPTARRCRGRRRRRRAGRGPPRRARRRRLRRARRRRAGVLRRGWRARASSTFATGEPLRPALVALADAVRAGRVRRLELERVDGEPVLGSASSRC